MSQRLAHTNRHNIFISKKKLIEFINKDLFSNILQFLVANDYQKKKLIQILKF